MNNLLENKEFNEIPVLYCTRCLSLNIKGEYELDYCDDCTSVEISRINIINWEQLYQDKFKKKYIEKTFKHVNDPRLFIFLEEIKNKFKK